MDNERNQSRFESVYSSKVRAGKRRTYFFDVRQTKGNDYFLTITESARKFNGEGYERHKIFLYKEDFNRFIEVLGEAVNHIKTELMPDYDYDEFARRQAEWEANRDNNEEDTDRDREMDTPSPVKPKAEEADISDNDGQEEEEEELPPAKPLAKDDDEDMSW